MYVGPKEPPITPVQTELDFDKIAIIKEFAANSYDHVQLYDLPVLDYDDCGFNLENPVTKEFEVEDFLSDYVKNATDFLNFPGIVSPVLTELGVRVEILTDDMAESDALKNVRNETSGEMELFVMPFDVWTPSGASQIVIGSAIFVISSMALALLN